MASSKLDADAKRMGSRGLGGYTLDRMLGRHDFSDAKTAAESARSMDVRSNRRKGVSDEAYRSGGAVNAPDLKPSNPSPYGGERLLQPRKQAMDEIDRFTGKAKVYDKQAADAKANRKEAEAEGQKYKSGGRAYADEYKLTSPAGKNPHERFAGGGRAYAKGGVVSCNPAPVAKRRGYGKARKA